MAQLARAPALQAGGRRFESVYLHQMQFWHTRKSMSCVLFLFSKSNVYNKKPLVKAVLKNLNIDFSLP